MRLNIDINIDEYKIINQILKKHLKNTKVYIFGSRVKNSSRFNSDLDIALQKESKKIDQNIIIDLKEDFNDSNLSYSVDIVDLNNIDEKFKSIIDIQKIEFPLKMNIPKLRFKEFNGEWEERTFKDIVKLQRGSSPRPILKYLITSEYGLNWIKIGDILEGNSFIDSTKERITEEGAKKSRKVNKGEIILSNSMSYGKPIILNIDGYIHDGWFVIRNFANSFDKVYLLQVLASEWIQKQYKRLAAGGVVNNISSELVNSVKLNLPQKQEQEKIAEFLSSIDNKIELLNSKEKLLKKYKKGLMQKIFSQQIRFKSDDKTPFSNWEEKKLGDIINEYNQRNKNLYPQFTIGKKGINLLEDSRHNIERHKIFKLNDFVIGIGIDEMNVNTHIKNGCCSPIYNVFQLNNSDLISLFAFYYLPEYLNKNKRRFTKKSTRREYEIIKIDLLKEMILLPSLKEQKKIASFLSSIDIKVKYIQNQLKFIKEYKKGLLQQMFI
jgi:type I restriction enzyme, S subunit